MGGGRRGRHAMAVRAARPHDRCLRGRAHDGRPHVPLVRAVGCGGRLCAQCDIHHAGPGRDRRVRAHVAAPGVQPGLHLPRSHGVTVHHVPVLQRDGERAQGVRVQRPGRTDHRRERHHARARHGRHARQRRVCRVPCRLQHAPLHARRQPGRRRRQPGACGTAGGRPRGDGRGGAGRAATALRQRHGTRLRRHGRARHNRRRVSRHGRFHARGVQLRLLPHHLCAREHVHRDADDWVG
mmetsp:Transcript_85915/g.175358  ORF Transcript_85915/g.175358 Transcript_85915/m.175358 type:complete len:239 (+) Transcript_85915:470-1186(+)